MKVPSKFQLNALLVSIYRNYGKINQTSALPRYYSQNLCGNYNGIMCSRFKQKSTFTLSRTQNDNLNKLLTQPGSICVSKQRLCFHQDMSSFHTLHSGFDLYKSLEKTGDLYDHRIVRHKSRKKRHDSDDESDSDADDELDEDDFEAPAQFKIQKITVSSLRIDAILSHALGLSRHRLEEIFFGPGILLNGKKVLKKAEKMDEGDYLDAIMEKCNDQVKVKRVKLLKVGSQKTSTDKFIVKVRVWKAPFLIDNPDPWEPSS